MHAPSSNETKQQYIQWLLIRSHTCCASNKISHLLLPYHSFEEDDKDHLECPVDTQLLYFDGFGESSIVL